MRSRHLWALGGAGAALALAAGVGGLAAQAQASPRSGPRSAPPAPSWVVYAGYADCPLQKACYGSKITNPRFPSPWYGAKGFTFVAATDVVKVKDDDDPDTSAIRVTNTGKTTLVIGNVQVKGCDGTLDLWDTKTAPFKPPYDIAAGKTDVFSSTDGDNFDGSEQCSAKPTVIIKVDGTPHSYKDDIANGRNGAIVGGDVSSDDGDESTPWTKLSGAPAVKPFMLPSALPPGHLDKSYLVVTATQGSNGAPAYKVTGLPPGVSFSFTGENASFAGKPTKAGTYTVSVAITDTANPKDSGTTKYTLVVNT
jgi:hypothetical protein